MLWIECVSRNTQRNIDHILFDVFRKKSALLLVLLTDMQKQMT